MKYRELIEKLKKLGWNFERHGGNHDIYKRKGETIEIPRHKGEVPKGLAIGILKKAK